MTSNEPEPTSQTALPAFHDIDWPLINAARPLLPPGTSHVVLRAVLGSIFRSRAAPAIYADLHVLCLPGLVSFGIDANAARLPDELAALGALSTGGPESTGAALYQFEGEPIPPEDEDAEPATEQNTEEAACLADADTKQTVVRAGLLREVEDELVTWGDADGRSHKDAFAVFQAQFSRTVQLKRGSAKSTRRAVLASAVQRAVIFALAYPDRFLSDAESDASQRADAAAFLREASGKQRDPISLRWRQAAERFEEGQVGAAIDRLYDSVLRGLSLPQPVLEALSWPRDTLSNMERRELIYLARAGNRDLKVLAARRLEIERWAMGVRQTLEELKQFPDPLVRGAAKKALSADVAEERR